MLIRKNSDEEVAGKEKNKMFIGKAVCTGKTHVGELCKRGVSWEPLLQEKVYPFYKGFILYKGIVFLSLCLPTGQLCSLHHHPLTS